MSNILLLFSKFKSCSSLYIGNFWKMSGVIFFIINFVFYSTFIAFSCPEFGTFETTFPYCPDYSEQIGTDIFESEIGDICPYFVKSVLILSHFAIFLTVQISISICRMSFTLKNMSKYDELNLLHLIYGFEQRINFPSNKIGWGVNKY